MLKNRDRLQLSFALEAFLHQAECLAFICGDRQ